MEKRSEIKNILIIMMIVLLMIGCGQQTEGNSAASGGVGSGLSGAMMEVGRSAENVFYAFIELVSDVLGFTAKTTTKKNDVGVYFNSLGVKLGEASKELEEVAKKAADSSKSQEIRGAVYEAKATLSKLKGHVESLGQVGDTNVVGYANNVQGTGTAPDDAQLKEMFRALKGIVEIATDVGVKALEAGATTLTVNGVDNKDGVKILATSGGNPAATDAGKAAIILAAVSGEEILKSIIESQESDVALTANADENTTSLKFAKGGSDAHLSNSANPKAAAVAGGIALRSLVKTGKLASGAADNAAGGGKEVQGVGATAANKLLVAIEDIIKKTVKNVLEKAKEKIDEARNLKTAE
ncbi:variable large family protein [Borrelia miyamotoi]|uniref:Variable large protein n=1 Tax=Borrelia miyamotoi TaxID=47466 RepID=A0AAQ3AHK8_9SPIR|nr:variable large family protein [Borrelia miyamotoi]AOW96299.1 Variable large protein 18 [Borrelia miyamotoi]QTL84167.1 variable large family protein [Borrelia miyamotoi]WAZ85815.1 variable large family protein [Borrelia miyamotoi]WAZ91597.1 variable large family protein [Borrelia miyamotoi]WAZ92889.1 variable large family protein [Borrelia miyamotoi]